MRFYIGWNIQRYGSDVIAAFISPSLISGEGASDISGQGRDSNFSITWMGCRDGWSGQLMECLLAGSPDRKSLFLVLFPDRNWLATRCHAPDSIPTNTL